MVKINKHLIVGERVLDLAIRVLDGENYDIMEEGFANEEIADAASEIAERLAYTDYDTGRLRFNDKRIIGIVKLGLTWKVNTGLNGSWVSCSNDNATGLSRSAAFIFSNPYKIEEDEVHALLDMMNEAYYLLENGGE